MLAMTKRTAMNQVIEPQTTASSMPMNWRFVASPMIVFIVAFLLVTTAELLIALVDIRLGVTVQALLLLSLTLYAGLGHNADSRKLALVFTLVPLMCILPLVLPLANLPWLTRYLAVVAPLLVSALLVIRQVRMSRLQLGLRTGNLLHNLVLMCSGLGIGAIEYALLGTPQPLVSISWNMFIPLMVLVFIFTGFTEELIFRSLLQAAALPTLGRWSLLYVSLLFAVLQIGHLSVPVLIFALGIGLAFSCAARWSGSIVGVALAHGMANITLFILMPIMVQQATSPTALVIRSVIAASMVLTISALAIILGRSIWQRRSAQPASSNATMIHWLTQMFVRSAPPTNPAANLVVAVPMIRTLRRTAGITYVELAQRTQLPARLLAEIEYGLRPPDQEQLGRIFRALDVDVKQLVASAEVKPLVVAVVL